MQHFCSSLDAPDLPAGLTMAASLRALDPRFRWHVLCLSDATAVALATLSYPDIAIVRIGALEDRFAGLAAARAPRSPTEQAAMLAPFLAAHCLDSDAAIGRITAIPPTLLFYADPTPVFGVLGATAIGLIRAGEQLDAAWISYPATDAGRRCLAEHQAACLTGDGDALAQWPARYPEVAVVAHGGANVTAQAVAQRGVSERDGRLRCGDQPLLWYRFEHLRCSPHLTFDADRPAGADVSPAQQRLYRGYFSKLVQTARELRARFPSLPIAQTADPATGTAAASAPEWAMQPEGWREETSEAGWNDEPVNQLRLHRLLDVNARIASSAPLDFMAWRLCITLEFAHVVARAARAQSPVSVLDWGGGLGEHFLYLRALWPELAVDYHVRDVDAVCDYGRAMVPGVTFHDVEETALGRDYDVVFASSVLQYDPAWQATVGKLIRASRQFLMLTRLPMVGSHPTFVVRQCPQLYGGTTSYQSWVFNQQSFLDVLGRAPVTFVRETLVEERTIIPGAPEQPISRGLLLARRR